MKRTWLIRGLVALAVLGFGLWWASPYLILHAPGWIARVVRPCPPAEGFTGNCVESNLVFGCAAADDMCILPGGYYDANPDASPGSECDLELLPPLG